MNNETQQNPAGRTLIYNGASKMGLIRVEARCCKPTRVLYYRDGRVGGWRWITADQPRLGWWNVAAWAAGRPASLKHLTEAHISLNFRARQRGAGSLAVMAGLLPHPPCPSYAARHRSHTAGSSNITTIVFLPVVSDVPCSPRAGAAVTPPGTPKPSSPPPRIARR